MYGVLCLSLFSSLCRLLGHVLKRYMLDCFFFIHFSGYRLYIALRLITLKAAALVTFCCYCHISFSVIMENCQSVLLFKSSFKKTLIIVIYCIYEGKAWWHYDQKKALFFVMKLFSIEVGFCVSIYFVCELCVGKRYQSKPEIASSHLF